MQLQIYLREMIATIDKCSNRQHYLSFAIFFFIIVKNTRGCKHRERAEGDKFL